MRAELIADVAGAERLAPAWDRLALACSEPTSAPSWMLGWWRHAAPPTAELRIVAVHDGDELTGLVPLYVDHPGRAGTRAYRLLADSFASAVTPLARPDRAWDVAGAAAALLADAEPRPARVELGPLDASAPWATALRERWPGPMRPLAFRRDLQPSAVVWLTGCSFDEWLGQRGARFRANARRYRRLFAEARGAYRYATAETIADDVRTFATLHAQRWQDRGRSRLVELGDRLPALLGDVAAPLIAQGRFQLLLLEVDGEAICADLWLAAGDTTTGINIGWDERHKRLSPPRLAFLRVLEDACASGARRMNLGWGRIDYKQGYTDEREAVAWDVLLPPGPQLARALPSTLTSAAGRRLRQSAKRILPERGVERLRALRDAAPASR